jgi:N-acetyl sugar amidotransferase
MDTTDADIRFDVHGRCNHCVRMEGYRTIWNPDGDPDALEQLMERIKRDGRGSDYDAVMGLSGGVDSSYVAWLAKQYNLRVLLIHVDTGWNSELAVSNIEAIVRRLNFELVTHVVDWEEMRDLQTAFLRSGVPNQDIPQDHAINAGFFSFAASQRVRWSLSGSNFACEGILPSSWGYDAMDLAHIRDIHRLYGQHPLRHYPRMSYLKFGVRYQLLGGLRVARLLNFVRYDQREAIATLERELGWRYYGGKHYESRFTKWFQCWYLPSKWGYDKRLAHLSSMVVSGQLTRESALLEMAAGVLPTAEVEADESYMIRKLGIDKQTYAELMAVPNTPHENYARTIPWQRRAFSAGARIMKFIRELR